MENLAPLIDQLRGYSRWGNSGYDYVLALIIFLGILIVLYIFRTIILVYLRSLSKKTKNQLDDILTDIFQNVGRVAYPALGLYIGLRYLTLSPAIDKVASIVFIILLAYEALKAAKTVYKFYVERRLNKFEEEREKQGTRAVMNIIWALIAIVFWASVALVILSNLGINVTSLVASLGIGGIAIALAVQNVLSDLLSSFSIYIDKPFTVGDYVVVGTDKGTVEKIGLKSTRLRALTGEELVISNKELTAVRINNYKRMDRRRDEFVLGVAYDTPQSKLEKIPQMVEEIVSHNKELEFDRCRLVELGDYSLKFSVVVYIETADYNLFLAAKEKALLEIFARFKQEKIAFAYPTQEVVVKR